MSEPGEAKRTWSRRRFLEAGPSLVVGAGSGSVLAAPMASRTATGVPPVYERLGVQPFINAAGTYTALTASLIHPEVVEAMQQASQAYVSLHELHQAAGARIAELTGAQAALVTSGCAAALTVATAACVCGNDQEKIRRTPDLRGMKNEVILMKGHRVSYDHALRAVGVELIEVENVRDLERAINHRTAMLFFLNYANERGFMNRERFAAYGRKVGIPTLNDAAADLPPVENLSAYTKMGFDLVAFSGGKALRGPQSSGLLLGRKDLIDAAYKNGSPHSDSIARGSKVDKVEIVGLTRAVELYMERDHQADWNEWERRVSTIISAVEDIDGVTAHEFVPEIANAVPHAAIEWERSMIRDQLAEKLTAGTPRIEPRPGRGDAPRLDIGVWMMEPGDAEIVADRLRSLLSESAG